MLIEEANRNPWNLIEYYRRLSAEEIKTHDMTYIGQQTSQAQNSVQVYHCIYNYIKESAHLNIVSKTHKYTMKVTTVGELMFKLLMQKAVIYTSATSSHLRENLTNLERYITTVNSNIRTFNQHVKVNVEV